MNVNVKLSLSDDERRALASYLAGKPVKRLATRADVNAIVAELLGTALATSRYPDTRQPGGADTRQPGKPEAELPPIREPQVHCSEDCCKANELLLHRVNVLQHRLDTSK